MNLHHHASGMWAWAKDHWILTTLLALTTIQAVDTAVTKAPNAPKPAPSPTGGT